MKVERTAATAFKADFESEQEVQDEYRTNLSFGALRLPTAESVATDTVVTLTLRGR